MLDTAQSTLQLKKNTKAQKLLAKNKLPVVKLTHPFALPLSRMWRLIKKMRFIVNSKWCEHATKLKVPTFPTHPMSLWLFLIISYSLQIRWQTSLGFPHPKGKSIPWYVVSQGPLGGFLKTTVLCQQLYQMDVQLCIICHHILQTWHKTKNEAKPTDVSIMYTSLFFLNKAYLHMVSPAFFSHTLL